MGHDSHAHAAAPAAPGEVRYSFCVHEPHPLSNHAGELGSRRSEWCLSPLASSLAGTSANSLAPLAGGVLSAWRAIMPTPKQLLLPTTATPPTPSPPRSRHHTWRTPPSSQRRAASGAGTTWLCCAWMPYPLVHMQVRTAAPLKPARAECCSPGTRARCLHLAVTPLRCSRAMQLPRRPFRSPPLIVDRGLSPLPPPTSTLPPTHTTISATTPLSSYTRRRQPSLSRRGAGLQASARALPPLCAVR